MTHRTTWARLARVIVLALTLSLVVLGGAKAAHASGPPTIVSGQVTTQVDNTNSASTLSASFASATSSGNEAVVIVHVAGGNTWNFSVADGTNTYSQLVKVNDSLGDYVAVFAAHIGSNGSADTITLTPSEVGCPCGSVWIQKAITIVEITNQDSSSLSSGYADGSENGGGGNTHSSGTGGVNSLSNTANDLDLFGYTDYGAAGTLLPCAGPTCESEVAIGTTQDNTANFNFIDAKDIGAASFTVHSSATATYTSIAGVSIAGA